MALTFNAFRNNFSRPNVDPKYISCVNLVNIGPVDQTLELTTDILTNKRRTDICYKNPKQTFPPTTQNLYFFSIPYYSKVYVRK